MIGAKHPPPYTPSHRAQGNVT